MNEKQSLIIIHHIYRSVRPDLIASIHMYTQQFNDPRTEHSNSKIKELLNHRDVRFTTMGVRGVRAQQFQVISSR